MVEFSGKDLPSLLLSSLLPVVVQSIALVKFFGGHPGVSGFSVDYLGVRKYFVGAPLVFTPGGHISFRTGISILIGEAKLGLVRAHLWSAVYFHSCMGRQSHSSPIRSTNNDTLDEGGGFRLKPKPIIVTKLDLSSSGIFEALFLCEALQRAGEGEEGTWPLLLLLLPL